MLLNHNFYYYTKGIPENVCDHIIKKFNSIKFNKGTVKGTNEKVRKSKVIFSDDKELYDIINPFIHNANEKAGWNFQWDFTESCQFTKYELNQYYNWHQDGFPDCYPADHRFVNFRNKCRKLSTVIALSDGSKYKGGDFQIDLRDKGVGNQKNLKNVSRIITVEELRKKGTVIVFPSFIWHRVTPVLKGTRYSLVTWSLGQPWK